MSCATTPACAASGAAWENSVADWQWMLGVNLWGVIHGVRAFAPRLIAQDEGHIVNTASVAGLISPPGSGAYNVTKHAVVALSESLHHDLRERELARRRFGALPGVRAHRASPTRNATDPRAATNPKERPWQRKPNCRRRSPSGKLSADDVAQAVVAAVKEDRFYILTHPRIKGAIQARMEDVLDERAPRDPLQAEAKARETAPSARRPWSRWRSRQAAGRAGAWRC